MNVYGISLTISGVFTLLSHVQCNLELVWPLNNYTYTAEIFQNASNQDRSAGCNLVFASDKPDGFPLDAVSLDGSKLIEIAVENVVKTNDDYTFSLWFKTSTPDGALFHYKGDDATTEFQELKAVVQSGSIRVNRVLKSGIEKGTTNPVINLDTWYYLSFGIDISNGKMKVEVDQNTELDLDNNFVNNIDFVIPGTLRIGGTFDGSDPLFNGLVTCMAFYSKDVKPKEKDSQNQCLMATQQCELYLPVCKEQKLIMGFYYSHSTELSYLHAISQSDACSVFECGVRCLNNRECKYFQYDMISGGCITCILWKIGTESSNPSYGQMFELDYTL